MTTERMADEQAERDDKAILAAGWKDESGNSTAGLIRRDWLRARRVEQEQAEKIRKLEDMLRLANDKMDAQVRQARWEVACEALDTPKRNVERYLMDVRDANAPKD